MLPKSKVRKNLIAENFSFLIYCWLVKNNLVFLFSKKLKISTVTGLSIFLRINVTILYGA